MKSEHRHELKTNELAQWLNDLPQWTKKNAQTIIIVSVVVVVAVGLYIYRSYGKNVVAVKGQVEFSKLIAQLPSVKTRIIQTQGKGVDNSYQLIGVAQELKNAAQNTSNDEMAALAMVKQAEILRTELHYRLGTLSREDLKTQIKMAKAGYNAAMAKAHANPSIMGRAKLGLGLCEEEIGNFEQAGQIYRDIAANTDLEGTIAVVQAVQRLKIMAEYQGKAFFRPLVKPAKSGQIQPRIRLNVPEANLPSQ